MNTVVLNTIVKGNIESLDQMISFIDSLSDTEYQHTAKPWFDSSIGQHLRHILDLFLALMNNVEAEVNYDIRRRGAPVESSRQIGLKELNDIRCWAASLNDEMVSKEIIVHTETGLSSQQTDAFKSSFGRELCFASSHLVHHLAIMAAIAKISGKEVDAKLGLAPATATYVREQENSSGDQETDQKQNVTINEHHECAH